MPQRTVITKTYKPRRTPLGDVVTVRKVAYANGRVHEHITVECPLELAEPGRDWPTREHT